MGGVGGGTYTGDTRISGGILRPAPTTQLPHGAGKGNMVIDGGATFDILDRSSIIINGLTGSGTVNSSDAGGNAGGLALFTVGDGDASAEFDGVIETVPLSGKISGKITLVKIGTGTQTLTGINTYSGTTTVSNGTLLVDYSGTLPTNTVTVDSGGTLGGSGTIKGPVTVASGGTISAGDSGPGTLTLAVD